MLLFRIEFPFSKWTFDRKENRLFTIARGVYEDRGDVRWEKNTVAVTKSMAKAFIPNEQN
jgi:hypothetical protein